MNADEINGGQGTPLSTASDTENSGTENAQTSNTVGSPVDHDPLLADWEKAIVLNLNHPPERSLPSVVLPEPPYFDRTIVDRERFMARARPKITKDVLKSIIRGGGDLMRGILVSADGETYYVPHNLMNGFSAGEIDVPITIDEPSWSPGRDGPGGGGGGKNASEDDSDIIYMPITYQEFVELIGLLFDLPFLKPTDENQILSLSLKTRGTKRSGPSARLLTIETAKARIERFNSSRNQRPEEFAHFPAEPGFVPTVEEFPFHNVDLRYRRIEEKWDPDSKAVIFYELDTSGSMGGEPLAMAKFFFLLMLLWLRSKYKEVRIVYIAHSGKATRIRNENDFFRTDANGGTSFTDAHEMVVAIARAEFGAEWNKYCFHATDGYEQSPQTIAAAIDKIIRAGFNLFGYFEVDLGWGGFDGDGTPGWLAFNYLSADTKPHCGRGRVKTMDEVPGAMKDIIDIENKS
jgi:uncharacterized sporulation protein YeaH/YhbH (DUF444 family)